MSYINLPAIAIGNVPITALDPEIAGNPAGAGQIGEILESSIASATAVGVGATGTWGSVTSIALTAGVWEITSKAGFEENGAVLSDFYRVGVSTSATGVGINVFEYLQYNQLVSGQDFVCNGPALLVNINAGVTYYLLTQFIYSSGAPRHYGQITARRYR